MSNVTPKNTKSKQTKVNTPVTKPVVVKREVKPKTKEELFSSLKDKDLLSFNKLMRALTTLELTGNVESKQVADAQGLVYHSWSRAITLYNEEFAMEFMKSIVIYVKSKPYQYSPKRAFRDADIWSGINEIQVDEYSIMLRLFIDLTFNNANGIMPKWDQLEIRFKSKSGPVLIERLRNFAE